MEGTLDLVVVIVLTSIVAVSQGETICIAQQESSECRVLNDFCKNLSMSDVTLYVSKGKHQLNKSCEVYNVRNWAMMPNLTNPESVEESQTSIHCSSLEDSGMMFLNVSGLTITGIEFIGCGMEWSTVKHHFSILSSTIFSALLFVNGSNLTLMNMKVLDSKSAGMYIYNVADTVSIDSCMVNNTMAFTNTTLTGNIVAYDRYAAKTDFSITSTHIMNSGYHCPRYNNNSTVVVNSSGLLLILRNPKLNISISGGLFSHNKGCKGGNMRVLFYLPSPVSISNTIFSHGFAKKGGGLHVSMQSFHASRNFEISKGTSMNLHNLSFIGNNADSSGGGLTLHWSRALPFNGIYNVTLSDSTFNGNVLHQGLTEGGAAISFWTSLDTLNSTKFQKFRLTLDIRNTTFYENSPLYDSEYTLESSVIIAYEVPYLGFHDITITNNNCTGVLAVDSTLEFFGSTEIYENRAFSGAGLKLCSGSTIYFSPHSQLFITNNSALQTGGGIYVCPRLIVGTPSCFYQFSSEIINNLSLVNNVSFVVEGNTAPLGGENIFDGSVDHCYFHHVNGDDYLVYASALRVTSNTVSNDTVDGAIQNSSISSPPQQICFHLTDQDGKTYCNKTSQIITVYPGKKITLYVYVVGQSNGSIDGTVSASVTKNGPISIIEGEMDQNVGMSGGNVTYTIYSNQPQPPPYNDNTTLFLKASRIYQRHHPAMIPLKLQKCPFGFVYNRTLSNPSLFSCQCMTAYKERIPKCSVECSAIIRNDFWVGEFRIGNKNFLAASIHCPFDYCNSSVQYIQSASDSLNESTQCNYNRTGTLCGACQYGLSMLLGPSSECRKCSNMWLLLILPFALAGLLLVAVIHFLNLTVASGTICGLIFYANILQDYARTFLEDYHVPGLTPVLLVFLSWLNLDLGIPTCFYNNMGAFGKTVLPFFFPLYLWIISALIIYLSNRYLSFTRFVGENATKVLATLFLLSYSKMFRIMASVMNVATVKVYINSTTVINEYRWIINGHIPYFDLHSHLLLVILTFLTFAIFFPFTLILLFLKQAYALSNYNRRFTWLNKLKPFFDSYTGPFKDNARFWTGLLLLVRIFALAVHTQDYNDKYTPYYCIIIVTLCLTAIMHFQGGVYQKKFLNALDYFFILNITCIFLINIYKDGRSKYKSYLTHILVSTAFLAFLGILGYHLRLKFPWMIPSRRCLAFWRRHRRNGEMDLLLSFDREEKDYSSTKSDN